jgi:hypothetical protein
MISGISYAHSALFRTRQNNRYAELGIRVSFRSGSAANGRVNWKNLIRVKSQTNSDVPAGLFRQREWGKYQQGNCAAWRGVEKIFCSLSCCLAAKYSQLKSSSDVSCGAGKQ